MCLLLLFGLWKFTPYVYCVKAVLREWEVGVDHDHTWLLVLFDMQLRQLNANQWLRWENHQPVERQLVYRLQEIAHLPLMVVRHLV